MYIYISGFVLGVYSGMYTYVGPTMCLTSKLRMHVFMYSCSYVCCMFNMYELVLGVG